jgi:hypothetical protein
MGGGHLGLSNLHSIWYKIAAINLKRQYLEKERGEETGRSARFQDYSTPPASSEGGGSSAGSGENMVYLAAQYA